jgi:hypothetical protein
MQERLFLDSDKSAAVELYLELCEGRRGDLVALNKRQIYRSPFPVIRALPTNLDIILDVTYPRDAGRDLGNIIVDVKSKGARNEHNRQYNGSKPKPIPYGEHRVSSE